MARALERSPTLTVTDPWLAITLVYSIVYGLAVKMPHGHVDAHVTIT